MQLKDVETDESQKIGNAGVEAKQYFINEENFRLIKQCQQEIYDKTEVSPALRKIVNELINEENLQKVKSKFIGVWSN